MSCSRQTFILHMKTPFLLNLYYSENYFFENVDEPT